MDDADIGFVAGKHPPESGAFGEDDYTQVFHTYFAQIVRDRTWSALPAGWHNPYSVAAESVVPAPLEHRQLQQYALDEAYALESSKSELLRLLEQWEGRSLSHSEVTLAPSVSSANLLTMATLADLGFRRAVFETPTYYASLDQARMLGLRCIRLPSYRAANFKIALSDFANAIRGNAPCSVWLTQPRFGLGTNQTPEYIEQLAAIIGPDNVLVLDEAAEQNFPSTLSGVRTLQCPMIRTRGIVKGIGLNGLRLACAIHPANWRPAFEQNLETVGASLDRFSLANASALAREPIFFASLLSAARGQVSDAYKAVSTVCIDTPVWPSPIENGYMSLLAIDFAQVGRSYHDMRRALLSACQNRRMPVVLKVSAGFADDESWEGIRLNYFTSKVNVVTSAEILVQAVRDVQQHFG
jgi:histidinol-phosphate/aromatic aminotransferase/cobyric acid decarboxylase-like protein